MLAILSIAFFVAIALLGYRLYRENTLHARGARPTGSAASSTDRSAARSSCSPPRERLFDWGGGGVVIWIALLGAVLVRGVLGLDELARLRLSIVTLR